MNDSKNMILAVVLSALVLLGWTWAATTSLATSVAAMCSAVRRSTPSASV